MHIEHEDHVYGLPIPHGHAVGDGFVTVPAQAAGPGQLTLLTPTAVHHQVFTVVRLRAGYDLAEVDAFLSTVETTISLLWQDNAHLRERLAAATPAPADMLAAAEESARETIEAARQESREAVEAATREAQETVEAARQEAQETVEAARREAHELLAEARAGAERVRLDAAAAAEALTRTARLAYQEAIEEQFSQFDAVLADHGRQLRDSMNTQLGRLRTVLEDVATPGHGTRVGPLAAQ
ncbi:DivIVA domain-containing protein [Nonomuraea angiospora]|uniref:DivIVA domain-containing protein n=1 Tax=Nonomuraea angiospora TaxID=46172 RepID=UPI0037AA2FBF